MGVLGDAKLYLAVSLSFATCSKSLAFLKASNPTALALGFSAASGASGNSRIQFQVSSDASMSLKKLSVSQIKSGANLKISRNLLGI